jgi:hypothetical protein
VTAGAADVQFIGASTLATKDSLRSNCSNLSCHSQVACIVMTKRSLTLDSHLLGRRLQTGLIIEVRRQRHLYAAHRL